MITILGSPDHFRKRGVLTRTPGLTPEDAVSEREETITLMEEGFAIASVSVRAKGNPLPSSGPCTGPPIVRRWFSLIG